MSIVKRFVAEIHEEFGTLGLRPLDMPHADPLDGMGIAHDVLEHFAGDDGGPAAEFMALGASLWVRDHGRYFMEIGRNPDAAENIAADFPDIMGHVWYEGMSLDLPVAGRRRIDDPWAELLIFDAIKAGMRNVAEQDQSFKPEEREAIRRYMRIGYRKAKRRFQHYRGDLVDLFRRIEGAAGEALHMASEGDEIEVKVCLSRNRVTVTEYYGC